MEHTTLMEIRPQADAEYELVIDNLITEMKHTREKMKTDQDEIERLRAQTRATLAQMKTS